MMIVLKTNDEMINSSVIDTKRKPKAKQRVFQNNEKRLMTIFKNGLSQPFTSSPVEAFNNDFGKNPKVRVFNIEN